MNKLSHHLLAAASALLASASALAQPLHLEKAEQLLDEILGAQAAGVFTDGNGVALNRYGGSWGSSKDPSFIRFADLENGTLPANNTKCSPFVTHLLKEVYGRNWKSYSFYDPVLKTTKSVPSPTPYQYIVLTKDGKGLQRVTRLDEAQPGDLLHWWTVGTDDSDHTMILVSVDWASAKSYPTDHATSIAELAGTTYYEAQVIDSSGSTHTNDSRMVNGTHIPGLGTGTIGVLVNANFELVGYTWSLPTSNYVTQRNGWMNGFHSRLRRLPTFEAVISRYVP